MRNISKRRKGISLITLIITIIVIILLAAIMMNTIFNTPQSASLAKFMQEIGEIQQAVSLSYIDDYTMSTLGAGNPVEPSDIYQEIARGDKPIGEDLTIYEDRLPYGIEGTTAWKIEDTTKIDGVDRLPDYDGKNFYLTDKGTVFIDGGYTSGEEIYYTPTLKEDITPPSAPTAIAKIRNINSIEVTASGSIDNETGIKGYRYKIDSGEWTDVLTEGTSHTFGGIRAGINVIIYAKAVNNVDLESEEFNINTATIGATEHVELSPSVPNSEWTTSPVTITLSYPGTILTDYVLQYKIGAGERWITGTSASVPTNTTVTGRLYKEALDDGIAVNSIDVANIDISDPEAPTTIEKVQNINSIEVTASGSTDIGSGVLGYKYKLDGENWTNIINEGTSYTFDGIKANTAVTIYAKAVDRALRESVEYDIIASTTTTSNKVTLTPSVPAGTWATGAISVTVSYDGTIPEGYVIQYRVGTGEWNTGTSAPVPTNTTVEGRLFNNTLEDEISANSLQVSNIDETSPTVNSFTSTASGWSSSNVTLTGRATDSGAGINGYAFTNSTATPESTDWTVIPATTLQITQTKEVSTVGTTTWYFWVKDRSGKTSRSDAIDVSIDATDPTINSFTSTASGWSSSNVTLTGRATDSGSGINGYAFTNSTSTPESTDWTAITATTSQITQTKEVSTSGTTKWYFWVKDQSGRTSRSSVINVYIDKTTVGAPTSITITSTSTGATARASGGTAGPSQVVGYQYSLNNSSWSATVANGTAHTFNGIDKSGGSITVYARTINGIGNASNSKATTVSIPYVRMSGRTWHGFEGYYNESITSTSIAFNCFTWGEFEKINIPIQNLTVGQTYTLSFIETSSPGGDFLSNYKYGCVVRSSPVTYDNNVVPDSLQWSYSYPGNNRNGAITFTATATTMYWVWDFSKLPNEAYSYISITNVGIL